MWDTASRKKIDCTDWLKLELNLPLGVLDKNTCENRDGEGEDIGK